MSGSRAGRRTGASGQLLLNLIQQFFARLSQILLLLQSGRDQACLLLPADAEVVLLTGLKPHSRAAYLRSPARFRQWASIRERPRNSCRDYDKALWGYICSCSKSQGEYIAALERIIPALKCNLTWAHARLNMIRPPRRLLTAGS
jgi:hypothetical protein